MLEIRDSKGRPLRYTEPQDLPRWMAEAEKMYPEDRPFSVVDVSDSGLYPWRG